MSSVLSRNGNSIVRGILQVSVKSSLKHHRKQVLRLLQPYGDQAFRLYSKFLSTLQARNHEVKYFIVSAFPVSGKSTYVVEEFSADRKRAIISWDHYLVEH